MVLPNFLVVGAPKCGTTALYADLSEHPEISVSSMKESHYFRLGFGDLPWNGPGSPPDRSVTTLDKYASLFKLSQGTKAVGEVCPSYFYDPAVPERIKKTLGKIRIIIMLRDPANRAYSHFVYSRMLGCEPEIDFLTAVSKEAERMAANWGEFWYYKEQSFYHDIVVRYQSIFSSAQVLVVLAENYRKQREDTLRQIYRFINVDESFAQKQSSEIRNENTSGLPVNLFMQFFLRRIRPILSNEYTRKIANKKIRMLYNEIIRLGLTKPVMTSGDRAFLVDIFRNDVIKLESLLSCDLASWRSSD